MPTLKEIRETPPSEYDALRLRDAMVKLEEEKGVEGLDEILLEIKNLKKLENYEKLLIASKEDINTFSLPLSKEQGRQILLLKLGYENLGRSIIKIPVFTDPISFKELKAIYYFLECFYYVGIGRKLKLEDVQKINLCGLDERLIFALNKFDEVSEVPHPTAEYIQELKKVRWENKHVQKFFLKIRFVMRYKGSIIFKERPMRFPATEMAFNIVLAGSNAINNNRNMMIKEDFVSAYKLILN